MYSYKQQMLLNLTLQSLEFVHNDYRIKKKKKVYHVQIHTQHVQKTPKQSNIIKKNFLKKLFLIIIVVFKIIHLIL